MSIADRNSSPILFYPDRKNRFHQSRSEDFKRGGGKISNVVVFKKILKN